MTFIEAARKSNIVRRPIAKHLGANKDGWIDAQFAFNQGRNSTYSIGGNYTQSTLLTWEDLMADDWEYLVDKK